MKVCLLGYVVPVEFRTPLVVEDEAVSGYYDAEKCLICIDNSRDLQLQRSTLLHEIFEASLKLAPRPAGREGFVLAAEAGWFSVLSDPRNNPVIEWIAGENALPRVCCK